jgi:hypothetical protein
MTDEIIDLLKIKIEKARSQLSPETLKAIDAVDWRAAILGLRAKMGYTFEQLGDLELETELVLCGLLSPEEYPKELENRMQISRAQANELVNEMGEIVFKKIREELIKNTERKQVFSMKKPESMPVPPKVNTKVEPSMAKADTSIMRGAGIHILDQKELPAPHTTNDVPASREDLIKKIEMPKITPMINIPKPETKTEIHPMFAQKLTGSMQIKVAETEHSLNNISRPTPAPTTPSTYPPKIDPYRLAPGE